MQKTQHKGTWKVPRDSVRSLCSQGLVMSQSHRFSHRTSTENMTWFSCSINFLYFCYITPLFLSRGDKGSCTWQSKWSECLDYSLREEDCLALDYHSLPVNPRHKNLQTPPSNRQLSSEKDRKKDQEIWKIKIIKRWPTNIQQDAWWHLNLHFLYYLHQKGTTASTVLGTLSTEGIVNMGIQQTKQIKNTRALFQGTDCAVSTA